MVPWFTAGIALQREKQLEDGLTCHSVFSCPYSKNVRGSAPKERAKLQSGVTTNTAGITLTPSPQAWFSGILRRLDMLTYRTLCINQLLHYGNMVLPRHLISLKREVHCCQDYKHQCSTSQYAAL